MSALEDARRLLAEPQTILGSYPMHNYADELRATLAALADECESTLEIADKALHRNIVHWIACSTLLDKPFSDAPDQSPWTRSARRAIDAAKDARGAIRDALA